MHSLSALDYIAFWSLGKFKSSVLPTCCYEAGVQGICKTLYQLAPTTTEAHAESILTNILISWKSKKILRISKKCEIKISKFFRICRI